MARYKDSRWPWIAGLACIAIGFAGLRVVTDGALWNRLLMGRLMLEQVGTVEREDGGVRHRHQSSLLWQDLYEHRKGVGLGDTIFTGSDGKASLALGKSLAAHISPNSLVVVEPEKQSSQRKIILGSGRLASLVNLFKAPEIPVIELERGKLKLDMKPGAEAAKVRIQGKVYLIEKTSTSASKDTSSGGSAPTQTSDRRTEVEIGFNPSDAAAPVQVSATSSIQLTLQPETVKAPADASATTSGTAPAPPSVAALPMVIQADEIATMDPAGKMAVAPVPVRLTTQDQKQFIAGPGLTIPVALRWSLGTEAASSHSSGGMTLEIDGDLHERRPLQPGESGASLNLAPGSYQWRITQDGGKAFKTEWRTFSVASFLPPKPRGPIDGIVLETEKERTQKVSFSWEGAVSRTELEIVPEDAGHEVRSLVSGISGAQADLGVGKFRWRLRSLGESGRISAWTPFRSMEIKQGTPTNDRPPENSFAGAGPGASSSPSAGSPSIWEKARQYFNGMQIVEIKPEMTGRKATDAGPSPGRQVAAPGLQREAKVPAEQEREAREAVLAEEKGRADALAETATQQAALAEKARLEIVELARAEAKAAQEAETLKLRIETEARSEEARMATARAAESKRLAAAEALRAALEKSQTASPLAPRTADPIEIQYPPADEFAPFVATMSLPAIAPASAAERAPASADTAAVPQPSVSPLPSPRPVSLVETKVPSSVTAEKPREPLGITAAIGITQVSYSETGSADYSGLLTTAKAAYRKNLFSSNWDLGLSGYATVGALSSNLPSVSLRFLGLNARLGYHTSWLPAPWHLLLSGGAYYTTTFHSVGDGFKNMFGPQLYPVLSRSFNNGQSAYLYLKFSPISSDASISYSSRETSIGAGWACRMSPHSLPIALSVDYSELNLNFDDVLLIDSRSMSLSIGTSW